MVATMNAVGEDAQSVVWRSDAAGLAQLALHTGALVVSGTMVSLSAGSLWLLLALPVHGVVLVFLFAPLHETIHRTAFRSRWINAAVSWVCGMLLILPPEYFRAFHIAHHRHTQDPQHDPELAYPKPASWRGYFWTVSGIPYWRERIVTICRHAAGRVGEPFIGADARAGIVREARMLIGVYAGIAVWAFAAGSAAPVLYWIAPALLGMPFLRMFLLAEHTGCPLVADMRANTRTTLTNIAVRRLAWNMPFHTAHHAYPGVPFHALPEVHRRMGDEVRVVARGYVEVQRELTGRFGMIL